MSRSFDIRGLVGGTPVIELQGFDTGPCSLFVKLESQNPSGSIKDRMALAMVEVAEQEGRLGPGSTIVEATAGNTGLSLAFVAAFKGYPLTVVVPDKMSKEKVLHLRALGVNVVLTRSNVVKGHPEYYQDLARAIAERTPGSYYINQFENPANPRAHELGTAPEIWTQMEHRLHAIVCGVGSGGTLTGLSRYFAGVAPTLELILADPAGSILAHYVQTGELLTESGSWLVEGIGEDFIPRNADFSRVSKAYTISDAESFETARTLLRTNGILAGSSSGTLLAAALRYCRDQVAPKRVLTFVCDSGNKYLSKMFSNGWMVEQGFGGGTLHGDIRDLISRKYGGGELIVVAPDDSLQIAYTRMRSYDVSQLPVLDHGKLVGIVDESDLLQGVIGHREAFAAPVMSVMTKDLEVAPSTATIASLLPLFDRGKVVIVKDGDSFLGLITKVDVLQYLRRGGA